MDVEEELEFLDASPIRQLHDLGEERVHLNHSAVSSREALEETPHEERLSTEQPADENNSTLLLEK